MAFRMVIDYEGGSWQPDVDGTFSQDAFAYHVSISCNHCNNPVCTRVCPTGAMHKTSSGWSGPMPPSASAAATAPWPAPTTHRISTRA